MSATRPAGFKLHTAPVARPSTTAATGAADERVITSPPSLNRIPSGLPPPPTRSGRTAAAINPNNIQVCDNSQQPASEAARVVVCDSCGWNKTIFYAAGKYICGSKECGEPIEEPFKYSEPGSFEAARTTGATTKGGPSTSTASSRSDAKRQTTSNSSADEFDREMDNHYDNNDDDDDEHKRSDDGDHDDDDNDHPPSRPQIMTSSTKREPVTTTAGLPADVHALRRENLQLKTILDETMAAFDRSITDNASKIDEQNALIGVLERELAQRKDQHGSEKSQMDSSQQKLQREHTDLKRDFDTLQAAEVSARAQASKYEVELNNLNHQYHELIRHCEEKLQASSLHYLDVQKANKEKDATLVQLQSAVAKFQEMASTAETLYGESNAKNQRLQDQIDKLDYQLQEKTRSIADLTNNLSATHAKLSQTTRECDTITHIKMRNEEKLTEALKQVRTLSQSNQELVGERYNRGKLEGRLVDIEAENKELKIKLFDAQETEKLLKNELLSSGGVRFDKYEAKKRMESGGSAATPSSASGADRDELIGTLKADLVNVSKALERKEGECVELQTICDSLMDELEAMKGINSNGNAGNGDAALNGNNVISPRRAGVLAGMTSPAKRAAAAAAASVSTPPSQRQSGIPGSGGGSSARYGSASSQSSSSSAISRDSNGRPLSGRPAATAGRLGPHDRLDHPVHDHDDDDKDSFAHAADGTGIDESF